MKMTGFEKETIILYNEAEKTASVYTYHKTLQAKLIQCCKDRPDDAKQVKDDQSGGFTFEVPKKWIKVSPPRRVSEEFRNRAREQMRKRRLSSGNPL